MRITLKAWVESEKSISCKIRWFFSVFGILQQHGEVGRWRTPIRCEYVEDIPSVKDLNLKLGTYVIDNYSHTFGRCIFRNMYDLMSVARAQLTTWNHSHGPIKDFHAMRTKENGL